MTKEIKEQAEETETSRNIQQFFEDMRLLSDQLRDKNLVKPVFDSGAPEVTNYILWLILGELVDLNYKLEEED